MFHNQTRKLHRSKDPEKQKINFSKKVHFPFPFLILEGFFFSFPSFLFLVPFLSFLFLAFLSLLLFSFCSFFLLYHFSKYGTPWTQRRTNNKTLISYHNLMFLSFLFFSFPSFLLSLSLVYHFSKSGTPRS